MNQIGHLQVSRPPYGSQIELESSVWHFAFGYGPATFESYCKDPSGFSWEPSFLLICWRNNPISLMWASASEIQRVLGVGEEEVDVG